MMELLEKLYSDWTTVSLGWHEPLCAEGMGNYLATILIGIGTIVAVNLVHFLVWRDDNHSPEWDGPIRTRAMIAGTTGYLVINVLITLVLIWVAVNIVGYLGSILLGLLYLIIIIVTAATQHDEGPITGIFGLLLLAKDLIQRNSHRWHILRNWTQSYNKIKL